MSSLERILAIERIMQENHYGISVGEIIDALENRYGIIAKRKCIYNCIAVLTRFMPIDKKREGNVVYWYIERDKSK